MPHPFLLLAFITLSFFSSLSHSNTLVFTPKLFDNTPIRAVAHSHYGDFVVAGQRLFFVKNNQAIALDRRFFDSQIRFSLQTNDRHLIKASEQGLWLNSDSGLYFYSFTEQQLQKVYEQQATLMAHHSDFGMWFVAKNTLWQVISAEQGIIEVTSTDSAFLSVESDSAWLVNQKNQLVKINQDLFHQTWALPFDVAQLALVGNTPFVTDESGLVFRIKGKEASLVPELAHLNTTELHPINNTSLLLATQEQGLLEFSLETYHLTPWLLDARLNVHSLNEDFAWLSDGTRWFGSSWQKLSTLETLNERADNYIGKGFYYLSDSKQLINRAEENAPIRLPSNTQNVQLISQDTAVITTDNGHALYELQSTKLTPLPLSQDALVSTYDQTLYSVFDGKLARWHADGWQVLMALPFDQVKTFKVTQDAYWFVTHNRVWQWHINNARFERVQYQGINHAAFHPELPELWLSDQNGIYRINLALARPESILTSPASAPFIAQKAGILVTQGNTRAFYRSGDASNTANEGLIHAIETQTHIRIFNGDFDHLSHITLSADTNQLTLTLNPAIRLVNINQGGWRALDSSALTITNLSYGFNTVAFKSRSDALTKHVTFIKFPPTWLILLIAVSLIVGILLVYAMVRRQHQKARLALYDEHLIQSLLSQTHEGVWIANHEFNVTRVNQAFTQISGFEETDILGKRPKLLAKNGTQFEIEQVIFNELTERGFWRGEIWSKRKNGEHYSIDISIAKMTLPKPYYRKASRADEGVHYIGIFSDISVRKNNEQALQKLATKDPVTGLANRTSFIDSLDKAIESVCDDYPSFVILFLDLDNFHKINNSLGHTLGDTLLTHVAERIKGSIEKGYTLARLGGDEFGIIVPPYLFAGQTLFFAKSLADTLTKQFSTPFMLDDLDISLSASIGIATYPNNGLDCENLMRAADSALNHAKRQGKNTYQFFDKSVTTPDKESLSFESAFMRAIENNDIVLHYQPKFDVNTQKIAGFEALARWPQEDGSILGPTDFIPLAESNGAIIPMTYALFEQACQDILSWQNVGVHVGRIAINISAGHFQQASLVDALLDKVQHYGLLPECFELEVTESAMMSNPDFALKQMQRLEKHGFHITLDDFGTGHSSLSYLKRFPIQTLKIDRTFIKDIATCDQDRNITSTIIRLAKYLDISVVAEGVESKHQAYILNVLGCPVIQGYFYAKAMTKSDVETWIRKHSAHQLVIDNQ